MRKYNTPNIAILFIKRAPCVIRPKTEKSKIQITAME
jgi:hypothetical protein